MRRAALLCALAAALARRPSPALARARADLVDVEDEVMCTTCNVPLNIAEAPQADRERAFIRGLIARGLDKEQIKAALVAEYGEDVLALPDSGGFGITAYAIPLGLVVVLAGGLALLLPSWRRRSPAGIGDRRRRRHERSATRTRAGSTPISCATTEPRSHRLRRADAEQVQRARDRALRGGARAPGGRTRRPRPRLRATWQSR